MSDTIEKNTTSTFRLLQADSFPLALDDKQIATVVEWSDPTPLPFAPAAVLGVVCIEGRMFTVVDLAKLLKPNASHVRPPGAIVALRGDEQLALAVDAAGERIAVETTSLSPVESSSPRLFRERIRHEQDDWQVLDVNELFSSVIQGRERRRRSL